MLCVGIMALLAGCETNQTRVAEGSVIGGVVGATAGGIIGHQSGHGLEGAGIGAAAGAVLGGVIGSQIDKPGQKNQATATPANQQASSANQMSLQQIVDLTKQGAHEDVIIDKIRLTNSKYNLTADDITYLKNNGVSQKVINAMQGA